MSFGIAVKLSSVLFAFNCYNSVLVHLLINHYSDVLRPSCKSAYFTL